MSMLLFILLSILLVIECITLKFDVISPSIILLSGYIISTFFLVLNDDLWKVDIGPLTIFILISSNIIAFAFSLLFRPNLRKYKYDNNKSLYYVSYSKTMAIVLFDFIISLLYLGEVRKIAINSGAVDTISSIMSKYRQVMLFSDFNSSNISFNFIIMQLFKFTTGFAYVSLFFLCKNLSLGDNLKNNRYYLYIIAMYFGCSWIQSSRLHYLQFILAFLVIYTICSGASDIRIFLKKNNKIAKIFIISICIFLLVFYFISNLVGRNININFFSYISTYVSGSLYCFNVFLKDYSTTAPYMNETFSAIDRFLYKLGLTNEALSTSLDFVFIYMGAKTNVYTALRRWISDFGYLGMYILQLIHSLFYSVYYKMCRERRKTMPVIILAYMYIAVLSHFFDDMLYKNFVSISFVLQIIIIYFSYVYIRKVKFRFKR